MSKKNSYFVHWDLAHNGKTYVDGDTVEMTDAEFEGLGGSGVVTKMTAEDLEGPKVSAAAAEMAAANGIDLAGIAPTGARGNITIADVKKAMEATPGSNSDSTMPPV